MQFIPRQARRLAELTQREMALKMRISRDVYREIELHPELATVYQATKISEITGIPVDQIFSPKTLLLVGKMSAFLIKQKRLRLDGEKEVIT